MSVNSLVPVVVIDSNSVSGVVNESILISGSVVDGCFECKTIEVATFVKKKNIFLQRKNIIHWNLIVCEWKNF